MRPSLRALIVDDERLARSSLRRLLAAHPEIEVVAEAKSAAAAAIEVEQRDPDVVFLDIQMPGGSGLTLFDLCPVRSHVVFVTAYDEHAVRAFEEGALDYLLKPVEPERLARTVERLHAARPEAEPAASISPGDRVSLLSSRGIQIALVDRITHITGADDYTEVHLDGGDSALSGRRMTEWMERLGDGGFFRVHRGAIVNTGFVEQLERSASGHVVTLRGVEQPVAVARRRVDELRDVLAEKG